MTNNYKLIETEIGMILEHWELKPTPSKTDVRRNNDNMTIDREV